MPEDTNNNQATPTTPPGPVPTPTAQGDNNQNPDANQTIPKHRFDEVNNELKEIKKWRAEQEAALKAAEDKKLADEGKIKELLEKTQNENKELSQRLQTQAIDVAIERAASKAGVSDSEAALKLIDRGSITIDPKTGEVSGVAEAVKTLTEAKPYLLGNTPAPTLGKPSNPGDANTQLKRFKLSQTQDHAFYEANKADIQRSMAAGLVEDDTNPGK